MTRGWKKSLLYLTPILLGCVVQATLTTNVDNENQQTILSDSIKKTESDNYIEGQRLYLVAIKQLETIEKSNTNTISIQVNDRSYIDRLIHKALDLWHPNSQIPSTLDTQKQQNKFKTVISMLEQSAREYRNNDALLLLAELNFFSIYTFPRNYHKAFEYYTELASLGNATAQQMIGFIYATGIGHVVERDQAKALLYHTFAAHSGETTAEMTMGYLYLHGIGTGQSCDDALYHYKNVANKAIDYYLSGPPGGYTPPFSKVRLSDENGGVYGYGASITTDKTYQDSNNVSIDEIIQYWKYLAAKQDVDAQLMLGKVYYLGTHNVPRNFKEALSFFSQIVDKISHSNTISTEEGKAIGQAAGYFGLMYWRGEGVEADENIAKKWFRLGNNLDDANSQNCLGMMYLNAGNRDKAMDYFKKAADQDNANGQVNLAIEYLQSDSTLPLAIGLFKKAADAKHLLAYWYLASLNEQKLITRSSCRMAVFYYKAIAEKGDWFNPTVEEAYTAYKNGDKENAVLYYMIAAERGYEVAQSNVAYILDIDKKILNNIPLLADDKQENTDSIHGLDTKESAFIYWAQSASQNNVDSRVKMGDYYYKGIGTNVDFEKALSCYRIAAEMQASPLAFWNLGWMYENGIGVSKDFHLAKRAYDQVLNIEEGAYLPVQLSILKIYIKYYWEWLSGHEVGPSFSNEEYPLRIKKQENDKHKKQYDIGEELERQYKLRKQKEIEEQERQGEEGYYEEDYDVEGDELPESVFILALCFLVGYLVYVRQFRFGNNNQNNNPQ